MSLTKKIMEFYENEEDIKNSIKLLYDHGDIKGDACQGIARQIMDQGLSGLSDKQKFLYEEKIYPLLSNPNFTHCHYCGEKMIFEKDESPSWCSEQCFKKSHHVDE